MNKDQYTNYEIASSLEDSNDVIHYGQHFLIDENVIDRFIDLAELKDRDVVEIGPGQGVLTNKIAPLAKSLVCYEIDEKLKPHLNKIEKKYKNTRIIYDNFLTCDIASCDTIISGLPYQILEPFLKKLAKIEFRQVLIIIGKNFAHSLYHEMFMADEIKFTNLLAKCFFFINVYDDISPSSFNPSPRTVSSIVEFKRIAKSQLVSSQELFLFREIYEQRDKKIKNALIEGLINYYNCCDKIISKRKAKEIYARLSIPSQLAEAKLSNLNNDQITMLYKIFKNQSLHL